MGSGGKGIPPAAFCRLPNRWPRPGAPHHLRPGPLPIWPLRSPHPRQGLGVLLGGEGAQLAMGGGGEAGPREPTGPDTQFPTLSPAVGAGCKPGGRAPFLKGPGTTSAPAPATCGGGEGGSPLPLRLQEKLTLQTRVCRGEGSVLPPGPASPTTGPRSGRERCRPQLGGAGPALPFRPLARPALPLASPRPAPIGRRRRRSGHFLLGRGSRVKLWRRKKSHRLPATLPGPTSTAAGNAPFSAGPRPDFFPASEIRGIPSRAPGPRDPSAHPPARRIPGIHSIPGSETPALHPQGLANPSAPP